MKSILNKIKNKLLSYHPSKKACFLFFIIPIIICIIKTINLDNDIWFLLNHGKYVLSHGIPTIEPFTIHSNLSFVMQQWLTSSIFWIIYKNIGPWGLVGLVQLVNILIIDFLYKLCNLVNNDKFRLSTIITVIIDSVLSLSFIVTRPQVFTYLNIIILLYILELYIRKNNKKALMFLPIISLLQINMHASMWSMLFIFILPFIADHIISKIRKKETFKLKPLLIIIIIMILVGFINPYGINAMTYVSTSLSEYINNYIKEMRPLSLSTNTLLLIFYFIIFLVLCCYIFNKKGKLQPKYFLLTFGTLILALKNIKGFSYFLIGGIYPLAYYLQNLFKKQKSDNLIYSKKMNIRYILVFILLFTSLASLVYTSKKTKFNNYLEKGVDYLLKHYDKKNIKLYVNYNNGGYTEYRGIKSYIDPRAEVFLKANNNKKDIFKEYYNLQNKDSNPDYFIRNYNFTHLLVTPKDAVFNFLTKYDKNYKIIYEEKDYYIFARKDIVIKS